VARRNDKGLHLPISIRGASFKIDTTDCSTNAMSAIALRQLHNIRHENSLRK
jgi:hypothetical protein